MAIQRCSSRNLANTAVGHKARESRGLDTPRPIASNDHFVRILLLASIAALSGCATATAVGPLRGGVENHAVVAAANGPVRTTTGGMGGSRTQTVGLPLSRAGKIGLWTGVAVCLAFLMADDNSDDDAAPSDP